MIRTTLRALSALLVVATLIAVPAGVVSAQAASQAITISPASTRISVDPGASVTKDFEIINGGEDGYTVDLSVSPYRVVGEQYDPSFTQLPGTVDASEWVSLSKTSEQLDGQKVLTASYTVTVPQNTAPGGYYAVVFAQTSQKQETDASGVIPHNRVGNILYITVNGDVENKGDVKGGDVPLFSFASSIPLGMKVSNTGGVHFETKAAFRVTDFRGNEVFKNEVDRFVLPSTVRDISTNWDTPLPFGIYTVERSATVAGETVTLDSNKIIVISPWFLFCVVIFLGSIITLIVMRVHQRKKEK